MATAPATTRLPNIKGWVYDDEDSYCRVEDEEAREMVTDAYDPTATYTQGATCIQDNKLYRAKADITTAEVWTPDHWEGTSLEQIRKDMETEISTLNANNIISSSKVSITLGSISNNINYLDKVNNIVICNIGLVLPSDTETTLYQNSVIGSIPDGYSPKNVVYISMQTRQNSWVIIGFSNDGNIFIQRFDSLGEQRLININASWVVK